jgi:hypothetical protein
MAAGDRPTQPVYRRWALPLFIHDWSNTDGPQHLREGLYPTRPLFGLFPGAAGGRALRDIYGRVYLVTITAKGGRTTLERYGKDYMRELASRGGKAKRHKEDTQPRNVTHWDGTPSATSPTVHPAAGGAGHASFASF